MEEERGGLSEEGGEARAFGQRRRVSCLSWSLAWARPRRSRGRRSRRCAVRREGPWRRDVETPRHVAREVQGARGPAWGPVAARNLAPRTPRRARAAATFRVEDGRCVTACFGAASLTLLSIRSVEPLQQI